MAKGVGGDWEREESWLGRGKGKCRKGNNWEIKSKLKRKEIRRDK